MNTYYFKLFRYSRTHRAVAIINYLAIFYWKIPTSFLPLDWPFEQTTSRNNETDGLSGRTESCSLLPISKFSLSAVSDSLSTEAPPAAAASVVEFTFSLPGICKRKILLHLLGFQPPHLLTDRDPRLLKVSVRIKGVWASRDTWKRSKSLRFE